MMPDYLACFPNVGHATPLDNSGAQGKSLATRDILPGSWDPPPHRPLIKQPPDSIAILFFRRPIFPIWLGFLPFNWPVELFQSRTPSCLLVSLYRENRPIRHQLELAIHALQTIRGYHGCKLAL